MPRYAPLPSISIDPRTEAQIVQDASQRVYEASGQTLNDFSAGNPLAALLEGQAFAQGEFLFWANQLPQSILAEWVGPFLGAMRRLGTPAVARLLLTVTSSDTSTTIPAGTAITTNSNLTGGVSSTFVTSEDAFIPAGENQVYVAAASQYVGAQYNVPANSITIVSATNIPGLTATNPQPAQGGSDVESYQEVQERFFSLIRRPNPVSAADWANFFIDFYGVGTLTSVQPSRPGSTTYNYVTDYLLPNGQVSFFVLGPDGIELNQTQLERGQNAVNFSVPVENQGHLYPYTLSQVQYDLTLEVDANGVFGADLKTTSLNFRDRLFAILTPGNVFPATVDPTVSDIDSAFYSTFGTDTRFSDPHIEVSAAYNTPPLLTANAATYTKVYEFAPTGFLLNQNDLVETTLPVPTFYPVLSDFTPYSAAEKDQPIYGNLELQQIQFLVPGEYLQGQVAYWDPAVGGDGNLYVITENLTIGSQSEVATLIAAGRLSGPKPYSPWVVGNTYQAVTGGGLYDPDIVQYNYGPDEFIPDPTSIIPQNKRPGTFVWVVAQNFTLQPASDTLTGAIATSQLGAPVVPQILVPGQSYTAGTWVYTPQIGSGPNPVADPYYNYVDLVTGVVNKYAYVNANFTYDPNTETVSTYFDQLVSDGTLQEIKVSNGDDGLDLSKYSPRFPALTYLEYRADVASAPSYYIATQFFTPDSTDSQVLLNEGVILPLTLTTTQYEDFVAGVAAGTVKTPVRMFRFFKGDRTFFRQGSIVKSYTATTNVHPLFEFYIYLENGIFVETEKYVDFNFESQDYIPYFSPAYEEFAEDTVVAADGKNIFRVMRSFTPADTVVNWTQTTVVNTARIEEYAGNLLRYVDKYVCEEDVLSQLGRDISAIKLGIAQITLIPRNGNQTASSTQSVFVWENTQSATEVPQLSWYTGTTYPYTPPNYRDGTLRL